MRVLVVVLIDDSSFCVGVDSGMFIYWLSENCLIFGADGIYMQHHIGTFLCKCLIEAINFKVPSIDRGRSSLHFHALYIEQNGGSMRN